LLRHPRPSLLFPYTTLFRSVGEELCLVASIPGASVDLTVAPHAEVEGRALLGDLLWGHASVDEVLDCLVVCVLCHFFFPFSLSVFSICHVRVICKAICHVCDESHIFRVGGRVAAFRLGLIGPPMRLVTPDRRASRNQ